MQFNSEQLRAIQSREPFIVVSAGAGSGKTRVLTERMIGIMEEHYREPGSSYGASINEIAAITFTEKAAREMKDRLANRIEEKAVAALSDEEKTYWLKQKEEVDTAMIATFHRFSLQLLKRFSRYTREKVANPRVLDETESALVKTALVDGICKDNRFAYELRLFQSVISKHVLGKSLKQIHSAMLEQLPLDEALARLDANTMWEDQKQIANEQAIKQLECLKIAIIEASAELPLSDNLTKSLKKHAQNLKDLAIEIKDLPLNGELINKIANALPSRIQKTWQEKLPALYDLYELYWKPFKKEGATLFETPTSDEGAPLLQAFITLLKSFHERYIEKKRQLNAWDFSDLQQNALTLLKEQSIDLGFKHILVDEFQDTNRLQLAIVEQINPQFVFFVGDEKQSIYRFRGSDVAIMNEMAVKAAVKGEEAFIELNQNYRTAPQLVQFVNALFAHAMKQEEGGPAFATSYSHLAAGRASFSQAEKLASMHMLDEGEPMHSFAGLLASSVSTEKIIVESASGVRPANWHDICVLLPSRTILPSLEEAFQANGIPYRVHGGVGFFEKQEVIDFLTLLNWLRRPYEDAYVVALLRSPLFGLSFSDLLEINEQKSEDESFALFTAMEGAEQLFVEGSQVHQGLIQYERWMEQFLPFSSSGSVEQSLSSLFEETGLRSILLSQLNGIQKVRNVEKLIALFAQMNTSSLESMCVQVHLYMEASTHMAEAEAEKGDECAVTVMTVHASKGLEFPVICLPQMDRKPRPDTDVFRFHSEAGIVFQLTRGDDVVQSPAFLAVKKEMAERGAEEDKRLFYVALTRAKDYCLLAASDLFSKGSWMERINEAQDQGKLVALEWPKVISDRDYLSTN